MSEAPKLITDLIDRFERNIESYRSQEIDDKTRLQRQIDATDKQIDQLVYELYGLTEEEIRIVEGANA